MKYGIISDIHSNLEALKEVIKVCKEEAVERYLCVGDIVGYAANPSECLKIARDLGGVIVAGNHDWGVSGKFSLEYFTPLAKEAVVWTMARLSPEEIGFLGELPLAHREENFTLVHGTLYDPEDFYYLDDSLKALSTFAVLDGEICFVGHTHKPRIFIEESGHLVLGDLFSSWLDGIPLELRAIDSRKYIINIGSVGQPRDGDNRASFVIYDTEAKTVALKRIAYDFKATQDKILRERLPKFLATRLSEGK